MKKDFQDMKFWTYEEIIKSNAAQAEKNNKTQDNLVSISNE